MTSINLTCDLLSVIQNNGQNEYLLYSREEQVKYYIPVVMINISLEIKHCYIFKKNISSNCEVETLTLVCEKKNERISQYIVGNIYEFEICNIESKKNRKSEDIAIISVKYGDNLMSTVVGLKWQRLPGWGFGTLFCEIARIGSDGKLALINKDFRHHHFEVDKQYVFNVIGARTKETINGVFNVLDLKGEDGCLYEVSKLPGQKAHELPSEIMCKIRKISTVLHLTQVDAPDPYFVPVEKIINDVKIQVKFFDSILEKIDNLTSDEQYLINQYTSKSAFWVFTYTNKILLKNLKTNVQRQNYRLAKEINNLIIIFEDWILNRGIIRAIPDEEIRESTRKKAKTHLRTAKIMDSILVSFCTGDFDFLKNNEFFVGGIEDVFKKFFFAVTSSNILLLDSLLFVERLISTLNSLDTSKGENAYLVRNLLYYVSKNKRIFITEKESEFFSLSSASLSNIILTKNELIFLQWSYAELLICRKLQFYEQANIICGQMLKHYTKCTTNLKDKQLLLLTAYSFFENYQLPYNDYPFNFDRGLSVAFDKLHIPVKSNEQLDEWNILENYFSQETEFEVILVKKSSEGFKVKFGTLYGFLPISHVKVKKIKNHPFEECDFTIKAMCLSISSVFNTFIITQSIINATSENYSYNNLGVCGEIYNGIIMSVQDYGFFVATNVGEGLVHISDIFTFSWNHSNIYSYFQKDQKIKICLRETRPDDKLSFSFTMVETVDRHYYSGYVENLLSNNFNLSYNTTEDLVVDTYFDKSINEKSFCIEQFAVFQTDISQKLHNFRIAKQFYQNAKNARSFLVNIYTSYFEIMLKIKDVLNTRSISSISAIRIDAQAIKNKINQRTLETFPDSEKLIFFIDIVSLFNEKSDELQGLLFDYIQKYNTTSSHNDLRTIAKITLANNLLISESNEDSDFCLRNLRLIFDYLSNGILSLDESIDDKNARELKEELLYYAEKIKGDESETLEFKSTFFTPILDAEAIKKLNAFDKIEKQSEQVKNEISKINGELCKKRLIHSALKTLVAFANTSGGTLLIGVSDDQQILGLELEYSSFIKKKDQTRDGFGKFFDSTIRTYIGDGFSSLMTRKFIRFPEGDVLAVTVSKSSQEVFLLKGEDGKDLEQLYIRNLSSSKELTGLELVKFVKNKHFGEVHQSLIAD